MTDLLVTGGAGFIGSHLVRRLLRNPRHRILVADNFSTGRRTNIPADARVSLATADVNQRRQVEPLFRAHRIRAIFHLAAVVGVDRTQSDPDAVLADLEGIRHLAELGAAHGVEKIYFASSSEVYGRARTFPLAEERSPVDATHPYAWVKHQGEALLGACAAAGGPCFTAFRFFNAYGPRQRADFVVARFVRQALAGSCITVHEDGTQRRTFCHVADTVDAVARIHEAGAFRNEVVNIGSDEEISMRGLAEVVREQTRSSSPIVHAQPTRAA